VPVGHLLVSTRTRQAAAFGAFRREGVESCRWGAFGAFFGAFSQVGGSPVGGAGGRSSIDHEGCWRHTRRVRDYDGCGLDPSTRRSGGGWAWHVSLRSFCRSAARGVLQWRHARRRMPSLCAQLATRRGTGSGRRMGGGSLGSAPERLGSGGCDAHACRDCSGGWELAGGHGVGGRARARACMWAAMRASHLAAGADIGDSDDHGWIARWANNRAMCLHDGLLLLACRTSAVMVSSRSHASCSML